MHPCRFPYSPKFLVLPFVLLGASLAFSQSAPVIGPPVNAGSYLQVGLPNSGIAQGSMFIIFGSGMNDPSKGVIFASSLPLQQSLGNTSVAVTVGNTPVSAYMNYVSAGQLAAVLPAGTPTGNGTITVTYNGETSSSQPILVVSNAFGALTYNQSGTGPGVIFNNSQAGHPVNNLLTAAAPGEVAVLWGTGLGAIAGDDGGSPTQSNQYASQTTVIVGGKASPNVQYAGSTFFAGIDQINFVIPSGVSGCWVPVYVVIDNIPSNVTTMAIAPTDGPCTDPTQISSSDVSVLSSGKNLNIGLMSATHYTVNLNLKAVNGALSGNFDQFEADFQQVRSYDVPFEPGYINPGGASPGYCAAGQFTYDKTVLDAIGNGNVNYPYFFNAVGAGASMTISGAAGSQTLQEKNGPGSGQYKGQLGGVSQTGGATTPTFFNPGAFTISNTSGETIGAFNATLNLPANLTWTNAPTPSSTISRGQAIFVNWTGASASEYVTIIGTSVNTTTNAGASFFCTVAGSAGSFEVPEVFVSMLPASGLSNGDPVGFLVVQKSPQRTATSFTAPGMDLGYLSYQEAQAVNVNFQ